MKHSDMNHLRRLLGWVRCEIGQAPGEMVATVQDVGAKLGAMAMTDEAMGRMVAAHDAARRVPAYVRAAIVALEQATFSGAVVDARRDDGLAELETVVLGEIEKAVLAERERCALLAESLQHAEHCTPVNVADAIRKGAP